MYRPVKSNVVGKAIDRGAGTSIFAEQGRWSGVCQCWLIISMESWIASHRGKLAANVDCPVPKANPKKPSYALTAHDPA